MSEIDVLERLRELRGRIVGAKQIWGYEEMLEALADAIAEIERKDKFIDELIESGSTLAVQIVILESKLHQYTKMEQD